MKGKFKLRKKRKEYGKLNYTIKLNLTKNLTSVITSKDNKPM